MLAWLIPVVVTAVGLASAYAGGAYAVRLGEQDKLGPPASVDDLTRQQAVAAVLMLYGSYVAAIGAVSLLAVGAWKLVS